LADRALSRLIGQS